MAEKETVVVWQGAFIDVETRKNATHHVMAITVDSESSGIEIIFEKGIEVYAVNIPMEHAIEIGFINLDALKPYCK